MTRVASLSLTTVVLAAFAFPSLCHAGPSLDGMVSGDMEVSFKLQETCRIDSGTPVARDVLPGAASAPRVSCEFNEPYASRLAVDATAIQAEAASPRDAAGGSTRYSNLNSSVNTTFVSNVNAKADTAPGANSAEDGQAKIGETLASYWTVIF